MFYLSLANSSVNNNNNLEYDICFIQIWYCTNRTSTTSASRSNIQSRVNPLCHTPCIQSDMSDSIYMSDFVVKKTQLFWMMP